MTNLNNSSCNNSNEWDINISAGIKLQILTEGISVDGSLLEKSIPDYLSKYRVKRNRKHTKVVDGKLYDSLTDDVPFIPEELFIHFKNGRSSVVKVIYKSDSNIRLDCGNGTELSLVHRERNWSVPCSLSQSYKKETGGILEIIGADRIAVLGYEGCSGWLNGTQCKFCDSAARRKGEVGHIPCLNDLSSQTRSGISSWLKEVSPEYFYKVKGAYAKIADKAAPHCHLHVMSGNLPELDFEWEYHIELGRCLNEVVPLSETDSYLNLLPPNDIEMLEKAKNAGFRNLIFNMEVWGEEDYRMVCPEKNHLMPMNKFMERIKDAVRIFGHNSVHCGFVLGAQRIERLKEACQFLTANGVVCNITTFTPKKGTPWENKSRPSVKHVAEFSTFLAKLLKKNNLSPLYCRMSSRSEVLWELLEDC